MIKNAEILKVTTFRGEYEEDVPVIIAVEQAPLDEEEFVTWREGVLNEVKQRFGSFYWTEIVVEWMFINGNEVKYIELGRL